MKKLPAVAVFFALSGVGLGQNLRIVNAASLSAASVSPGSIISIFGSQLARGVAFTTNVQTPPTSLGGVTVTIGGTAAALFYVSPAQINAVVGANTPAGTDDVVVTSPAGTHTGTATIDPNAPPGLFSLFGTGTRDGAILNAITFLLGGFSIQTANSPTFLALFATGLNPGAAPTVTIGGVPVTVTFSGPAPCCAGLQQINVMLPDSLAGAGRVPVVVTQADHSSNTVQVVLLPPPGALRFPFFENQTHSRELASLAYVPGSSLVLSTDENDDVVRVVDLSARQVTHVISLASGANPDGIAVNAAGTQALVAETGRGKAAVIDLSTFTVVTEVATGGGPVSAATGAAQGVVVNQDSDSVSIIDLTANTVLKTLPVGRGPKGVAVDSTANLAYVTNEDDGTISVIDLAALTVTRTISLGKFVRPEAIALIPEAGVAFVTAPAAGPFGHVLLVDLKAGTVASTLHANPDRSGGAGDVAFFNSKVYFANQAGGSVSVLPVDAAGAASGPIVPIRVDLGARALAIDTKDNLLVVSNEGTGKLALVDLESNKVVARIDALQSNTSGDDGDDDHSDHDNAHNAPRISKLSPGTGKPGASVSLTITGRNLTGATAVAFISPSLPRGYNRGKGSDNNNTDSSLTVANIQVNGDGTQLTATVAIATDAKIGPRLVKVKTPNGESSDIPSGADTFIITP